MAEKETDIYNALLSVTDFTSVRYIVREMQDETKPESLPFCVYTMGQRDYSAYQTFCGVDVDGPFDQEFEVIVFAKTAVECRALAKKVSTALSGVGVVGSLDDDYDPDLRCFFSTISFF